MLQHDQFYTQPPTAAACLRYFYQAARWCGLRTDELHYLEPSAGTGSFYDQLPADRRRGIDIAPQHPEVSQADFLADQTTLWTHPRATSVVIGNPPFGHRAGQAIAFFNRAAALADTIAFIVPVSFKKYRIHRHLHQDFAWIGAYPLPRAAFYTKSRSVYAINTEFQVWTRRAFTGKNLRQLAPPPIHHPDFVLHQYNNTTAALGVFTRRFAFAVPAQGYQDYSRRERTSSGCEKTKQWMLFDASCPKIIKRLWQMDFKGIAYNCGTIVPGFRKNDVIREYRGRYEA